MVTTSKSSISNRQLALAIQLNDEATLDDFCWNNNLQLKQLLESMLYARSERILYLWGNIGSGKSHLLQACCQAFTDEQSAIYLPLQLLKDMSSQALEGIEGQDLICIDDVDAIAGDKQWEETLFHLYNRIKDNEHSMLILSGNLPPAAMTIQLPDLRSRLGWGLIMQVHELEDADKIQTLQHHAKKRGFHFPSHVGRFLINRCSRNMHDLFHLLNHLDKASLAAQRKITIPFVKSTLQI